MAGKEKSDLFEFMLTRVAATKSAHPMDTEPQAFGRWFAELFYANPRDVLVTDGAKDGKIDLVFTTTSGSSATRHVVNSKYTKEFNKLAPPSFYQEIKYFWHIFQEESVQQEFLEKAVKPELRSRYTQLFSGYREGSVELLFITNHRRNDGHYSQVKELGVTIFHLDELIQCLLDDIDGAMPRTPSISLNAINSLLPADQDDTEVATSIVFARLIDFIRYMQNDPFDLLFNRNVRVPISVTRSSVNRAIRDTFRTSPKEFAYSNNGVTMLCDKQHYDPGQKVLTLANPRVVNGSQTLHSIRDVPNPSPNARVMVRVIEIEPPRGDDLEKKAARRKDVIGKIAVRSNQQNPIKSWDLASNDEFQLELFRYFRTKSFFYERRNKEWNLRSRELRSVGIRYATSIKWHTQIISNFYWEKAGLGPAAAKKVAELFEGEVYEKIRRTSPELAFQLYLVDANLWECRNDLAKEKTYISNLKSYEYFCLFSLATNALTKAGACWGNFALTTTLQDQWPKYYPSHHKVWKKLAKECEDLIVSSYTEESKKYSRVHGEELSYANFFKAQHYVSRILNRKLPSVVVKLAREAIEIR